MKFESYADRLLERPRVAFELAVDDVHQVAQEIAGQHSRTGRFARSIRRTTTVETNGRLEARVGSLLRSARAKEKGAWIAPKRGPYLTFRTADGWRKVSTGVRLAPQPAVTPAGQRFRELMHARLLQVSR